MSRFVIVAAFVLAPAAASAAGDATAGKTTYMQFCVTCHGEGGKGDGPVGKTLNPPPRDFTKAEFKFDADKDGKTGTDADLKGVITKGAGAYGGNQLMAPWGHLPASDVDNLIAYIRTLKQ
jgi:mono/diheme cytochrome c family protein